MSKNRNQDRKNTKPPATTKPAEAPKATQAAATHIQPPSPAVTPPKRPASAPVNPPAVSTPSQSRAPVILNSTAASAAAAKPAPAPVPATKPVAATAAPATKPSVQPAPSKAPAPAVPDVVKVPFALQAPSARQVWVCGDFNQWSPEASPLKRKDSGLWETTLSLKPGRYQYKFVADDQWTHDPNARENVPNMHGSLNSVIEVRA